MHGRSRAGGKTTRLRGPDGTSRFEIAVATSILFDGFVPGDPEVSVCGVSCRHRLEALQRLLEHELVHLAEWLCWDASHCGRKRFQGIAARLFRHRAHTHQLITRSERAAKLGIAVGARVTFPLPGTVAGGARQPDHEACHCAGRRSGRGALVGWAALRALLRAA